MNHLRTKIKNSERGHPAPTYLLRSILEEIQLLRSEIALLFPQEDLNDYAHPARLKKSYQNALKQYPPVSA